MMSVHTPAYLSPYVKAKVRGVALYLLFLAPKRTWHV